MVLHGVKKKKIQSKLKRKQKNKKLKNKIKKKKIPMGKCLTHNFMSIISVLSMGSGEEKIEYCLVSDSHAHLFQINFIFLVMYLNKNERGFSKM